jgi:hypothetical protein
MPAATLTARSLKCTLVLDPVAVRDALAPLQTATERIQLAIAVDGRTVRCDLAPKAVRRCFNAIETYGAEAVAVILQGKLQHDGKGDVLSEAGLLAQPKAAREPAAETPAVAA